MSAGDFQTLRNHLHQSSREHEAGAESDEVFKVALLPIALHDDGAAECVGGSGCEAEEKTNKDGIHATREYTRALRAKLKSFGRARSNGSLGVLRRAEALLRMTV